MENPHGKDTAHVLLKVTEVKNIMQQNIEKIMDRGQNLVDLEGKAAALETQANGFNKMAKDVRWKLWLQNMKVKLFIILVVLVVLALVIWLSVCQGFKCE